MTGCAQGSQVLRAGVALDVITMSRCQCIPVRVEWLTRSAALFTAHLTLPVGFFFDCKGYLIPAVRILCSVHGHKSCARALTKSGAGRAALKEVKRARYCRDGAARVGVASTYIFLKSQAGMIARPGMKST